MDSVAISAQAISCGHRTKTMELTRVVGEPVPAHEDHQHHAGETHQQIVDILTTQVGEDVQAIFDEDLGNFYGNNVHVPGGYMAPVCYS